MEASQQDAIPTPAVARNVAERLLRPVRRPALLVAVLFGICFLPRAVMAWRVGPVCDDGYYHVYMADSLRRGELDTAFYYLNLNVYPAILLALHRLGLDWIMAGKLWGLLASSLAVLPMYGWMRRLFDRPIAVAACFLYSIHPELIETSVEPIREPTFWLLANLSIYASLGAAQRGRMPDYILAGTALGLAVHTRVEGWTLVLPVILWSLLRLTKEPELRWRRTVGPAISLAVVPLLVVGVNLTLLRDHGRWEWGRLDQFRMCRDWIGSLLRDSPKAQLANGPVETAGPLVATDQEKPPIPPPQADQLVEDTVESSGTQADNHVGDGAPSSGGKSEVNGPEHPNGASTAVRPSHANAGPAGGSAAYRARHTPPDTSAVRHAVKFAHELLHTLGPAQMLFLIVGLVAGRGWLLDRRRLVLLLLALTMLLGVWIRLRTSGDMNGRYFFTLYLVLLPLAGLGLLATLGWLAGHSEIAVGSGPRLGPAPGWRLLILILLLTACGWGDAFSSRHVGRDRDAALGRRLREEFGPFGSTLADNQAARVGYYAQNSIPTLRFDYQPLDGAFDRHAPDLVILSPRNSSGAEQAALLKKAARLGYKQLPRESLRPRADRFLVLVRAGDVDRQPERRERRSVERSEARQATRRRSSQL